MKKNVFTVRQLRLIRAVLSEIRRYPKRGIRPTEFARTSLGRQYDVPEVFDAYDVLTFLGLIRQEK